MIQSARLALLPCASCSAASPTQPPPTVVIAKTLPGAHPPHETASLVATLRAHKLIEAEDGGWFVTLVVIARPPPSNGELPLRFEWFPTAYVERALVDGDEIVERRQELSDPDALVEVATANFIDRTTGRATERAVMPLQVSRERGFEAGEYRLRLTSQPTGDVLLETRVELQGENPLVDRRSTVFGP